MADTLSKLLPEKQTYMGLTSAEANKRLLEFGYNQRPSNKNKTWLKRFFDVFSEPMMLLLIITGTVYLFIGDRIEALVVWFSVIPIGLMEFFEERKTDEAIAILDKMVVQYAKVYRDGKPIDLEFKNVVPGDLIYMTAGDQVAADGYLFRSSGLSVDESVLTGESLSVTKAEANGTITEENQLRQGTLVVQGEGFLVVETTGVNTAYGKLGSLLEKIKIQESPLQRKIHRLVRVVAIVAFIASVLVGVLMGLYKGWMEGLLGGLTIAMSLIPEEFPIVFSVFLIMGMFRLAKQKSLVREMVMVETLGSATVICSDKTGTMTEGRMSLEKIYYQGNFYSLKDYKKNKVDFTDLIKAALLSLEKVAIDPMEIEVQRFAGILGINIDHFFAEYSLIKDSAFNAKSKMVYHVWRDKKGACVQYSVGAPESVLNACEMSEEDREAVVAANEKMAGQGFRVIAVATKDCSFEDEIQMKNMRFVGLLAMSDPPRPGVKEAVAICRRAGIKVVMITGDNKLTAHNIAESIKMEHNEEILSGAELEKMSPDALREAVKRHSIFARVQPEQKYLIVKALQANGEIVAMTGDGVNDAPALRQADIGIAMGKRGTDVARAASGMVLMDDNFSSIVNAVSEGRRIYDNLRNAFVFLLSFHMPIVGMAVLPLFFGQPLIFIPVNIIFLELICDPAAVLGFEREKPRHNLMLEKPRPTNEPLIDPRSWWRAILQGLSITIVSFGFYYYHAILSGDIELGRTAAFISLIISQIALIILTREWGQIKSNKILLAISLAIFLSIFVIQGVPPVQQLFRLVPMNFSEYVSAFAISFLSMGIVSALVRIKKQ